ncbi:MAG: SurA [Pelagibacterales bacterium MED-G41]|nr:MAG: SurA [Pelagibacterales bacterium MED-G41]
MILKKIKFSKKYLFNLLILFLLFNYSFASEVKIIKRINNEIVTNIDIEIEYNYLIALNNDLKNISRNEGLRIAEESLTREKIKLIELKKNLSIENFIENDLSNSILKNFYQKLKLDNENDFEVYLQTFNLTLDHIKKKIKFELLWNQLIGAKFINQIDIDEEILKERIRQDKLNFIDINEYDLSEIVFQAKDQNDLRSKVNKIRLDIDMNGFSAAANRFSDSNSSKFGGKIGKIKENQLSKKIQQELNKISIGQITNPINIGNGFIILYVHDKKISKFEEDEEMILKKMIEFERAKQFSQFSRIYFDKIKINTEIKSD